MSGEKTEQPTEKKLEDAREKGQVAVSKDAEVLFKLVVFYLFFFWVADGYAEQFSKLIDSIVKTGFNQQHAFSDSIFSLALEVLLIVTFPLVAVCAIAACVMTWTQIGFLVAPQAVMPSFKKFDAVSNLKNMFSTKSLVQLLISIVKVFILGWVGYLVFKDNMEAIVYSYRSGMGPFFQILMHVLKTIIFVSLAVFIVLAAIDWAVVYFNHIKTLRMSKHDVKDERKQSDGDPQMKNTRRQQHRSLINSSLNKMGGAKAIVANPTHISVALDYEPGKHDVPFILAMGEDDDALRMRQFAKEKGIPIIVNVKLARMLYQDCEEDEYIQKEHLELAAQVFKAVMQLAAEKDK